MDEFDITQVEQDRNMNALGDNQNEEDDISKIPADNRNAQIEHSEDNTTPASMMGAENDNRQEGFRLDQMSRDRTGDKLRKNLLSRLTYEKIWLTPNEKPKPYETAIIFDWDDTLLCTSFISPKGVYQDVELGDAVM